MVDILEVEILDNNEVVDSDINFTGEYISIVNYNNEVVDALIQNTLTSLVNDRVKTVNQYMCYKNTNLVEVDLPNVESIGNRAFSECNGLVNINLPKCTSIGSYGFQACKNLKTVITPKLKSLGGYTFQSCGNLEHIVFPKLETLGTADLYACNKLHTVDLHICTSISNTALPYCAKLTALILRSPTLCLLGSGGTPFGSTPIDSGNGFIYVPAKLIEKYKSDAVWSKYASKFRTIEDYPEICEQ